ncbi:MAG: hypothetical protein HYT27_00950 [Parcubacteria group bacterium]|nr:hypothetical protein [Parcubacteria group bacterium]
MPNHTSKKFLLGFLGILFLAFIVWSWGAYFNPDVREKRALIKYFEDIQEEYNNDTYGGAAPEETLQLFISALEAEDIELASKYFLPDEREKTIELLKNEFDVNNNFDHMVTGLNKLKRTTGNHDQNKEAFFIIIGPDNIVANQVVFTRNQNNVWKITSF